MRHGLQSLPPSSAILDHARREAESWYSHRIVDPGVVGDAPEMRRNPGRYRNSCRQQRPVSCCARSHGLREHMEKRRSICHTECQSPPNQFSKFKRNQEVGQLRQRSWHATQQLIAADSGKNHAIISGRNGVGELLLPCGSIAIDAGHRWARVFARILWFEGAVYGSDVQMDP